MKVNIVLRLLFFAFFLLFFIFLSSFFLNKINPDWKEKKETKKNTHERQRCRMLSDFWIEKSMSTCMWSCVYTLKYETLQLYSVFYYFSSGYLFWVQKKRLRIDRLLWLNVNRIFFAVLSFLFHSYASIHQWIQRLFLLLFLFSLLKHHSIFILKNDG